MFEMRVRMGVHSRHNSTDAPCQSSAEKRFRVHRSTALADSFRLAAPRRSVCFETGGRESRWPHRRLSIIDLSPAGPPADWSRPGAYFRHL